MPLPLLSALPPEFSHRLDWNAPINRLAEAARRHRPRWDLTASNPTRAGFAYPRSILDALASPAALEYAPDPTGGAKARAAAGLGDHALLSASTSEAYSWLFKLLCDPGDDVLVPVPSYPLFEFLAKLDGVALRPYSLRYSEGWWLDFASLEAALTPRSRAILVVHPNNPTGSYIKAGERERLGAICASRGLVLISDEVFSPYRLDSGPAIPATLGGATDCLTFTLGGLSKSAGMPQMKAAWLEASGPGAEEAVHRLELIADTYLSVSSPIRNALPEFISAGMDVQRQIQERIRANLDVLRQSTLRPLHVEGGWYAILPTPRTRDEEDWAIVLLEQDGTLTQPGYFYDFESEGWLVVSLLTPKVDFASGVSAIERRFTA